MGRLHVVAVTGGRNYRNQKKVWGQLDALHKDKPIDLLVHGGATGADALAKEWAESRGVQEAAFPVNEGVWQQKGKRAGPDRNYIMVAITRPALLVAFPGGRGTANCVSCQRDQDGSILEVL